MQALAGPLLLHLLTRDVLDAAVGARLDRSQVVDTFLRIFFHGVQGCG
jgi:hypothetical protein